MARKKYSGLGSAGISNEVRKMVYRRDGYMCALCGDPRDLVIHHYEARSQGGADHPMNLICLCNQCHMTVHGLIKPPADWMTAEEMQQAMAEYLGDLYADMGEVWYPWEG